jgi:hypothetical protein
LKRSDSGSERGGIVSPGLRREGAIRPSCLRSPARYSRAV